MLMSIRLNVLMYIHGKVAVTLVVREQSAHDRLKMEAMSGQTVVLVVITLVSVLYASGLVMVHTQNGIVLNVAGQAQVRLVLVVTEH